MEVLKERRILDLCAGSGAWSEPYRQAGYDVVRVTLPEADVTKYKPELPVWGVLAAPPCTEFAISGARWWKDKGHDRFADAWKVVEGCLKVVVQARPKWWALENPVGRLKQLLGEPALTFDPWYYGDPWDKRTMLWGKFTLPVPSVGTKPVKEWVLAFPPSDKRAALRSVTPPGFARAFFEANP